MIDYEMLSALEEIFERKLNEELGQINDMLDKLNDRALNLGKDMSGIADIEENDIIFYKQNVLKLCFADLTAEYLAQEKRITNMRASLSLLQFLAGVPITTQEI